MPFTTRLTATLLLFVCTLVAQQSRAQQVHPFQDISQCLYGFKGAQGNVVIEPCFEDVTSLTGPNYETKYVVTQNGKIGLLEETGQYLFPVAYDSIAYLIDSLYVVRKAGGLCAVGRSATNMLLAASWKSVRRYNKRWLLGLRHGKQTLISKTDGSTVLEYQHIGLSWLESVAVKEQTGWGVVSTANKLLVPTRYDTVHFLRGTNQALAQRGDKLDLWSVKTGDLVLESIDSLVPAYGQAPHIFLHRAPYAFYQDGKCGLTNNLGSVVCGPIWDHITPGTGELFSFVQDGLHGAMNKSGKVVVPALYESLQWLTHDSTVVFLLNDGKSAALQELGSPPNTTRYDWLIPDLTEQHVYFPKNGKLVAMPLFGNDSIPATTLLENNYSPMNTNPGQLHRFGGFGYSGWCTSSGHIVQPPVWHSIQYWGESRYRVDGPHGFALIDRNGKALFPPGAFANMDGSANYDDYGEELDADYHAAVSTPSGMVGVLNALGALIVDTAYHALFAHPQYLLSESSDTLAGFWVQAPTENWGMIDTLGNWLIRPQYSAIVSEYPNGWVVEKSGKLGFLGRNNKLLIPCKLTSIWPTTANLFHVGNHKNQGLWRAGDTNPLLPLKYNRIQIIDTFALAWRGGKMAIFSIAKEAQRIESLPADLRAIQHRDLTALLFPQAFKQAAHANFGSGGPASFEPIDADWPEPILNQLNNTMLWDWLNRDFYTDSGPNRLSDSYTTAKTAGSRPEEQGYVIDYSSWYEYSLSGHTATTATYTLQWAPIWAREIDADLMDTVFHRMFIGNQIVPITINDVFRPDFTADLSALCLEAIQHLDPNDFYHEFELNCATKNQLVNEHFTHFYPTDDGIYFEIPHKNAFGFDPHDLAPSAEILIPYQELARLLNPTGPFSHLAK